MECVAEWPQGSLFIRVYQKGDSYGGGGRLLFAVGVGDIIRNRLQLEAGIGLERMQPSWRRAIETLIRSRGFSGADWEKIRDGEIREIRRDVRGAS